MGIRGEDDSLIDSVDHFYHENRIAEMCEGTKRYSASYAIHKDNSGGTIGIIS